MNSDKIENTVKDTNTNKAGDNTTMVCPNCGGTMRRQNKMWICESCDHEMPVKVDY
jgi:ribosomal protein L37AE/L43A